MSKHAANLCIWVLTLWILGALFLLSSCNTTPRAQILHREEIATLSWFIEDVCHGIQRDSRELIQPQSSSGLLHIITWIQSEENNELLATIDTIDTTDESQRWPLHIRKRIATWKIIKPGIQNASINVDKSGILTLSETCSPLERKLYYNSIIEENQNRRTIDHFILQHSGLRSRSKRAQQLYQALITARVELDTEARIIENTPALPTPTRSNP